MQTNSNSLLYFLIYNKQINFARNVEKRVEEFEKPLAFTNALSQSKNFDSVTVK